MAERKAVRLDPELHAALTRRASRDGTTVQTLTDRLLRAAMREPSGWAASHARTAVRERPTRVEEATCPPHPVGRRIGDQCAACGGKWTG